jgi:hypothetical protein
MAFVKGSGRVQLMSNDVLTANLVNAVERLNASGDSWGWPRIEIARIAIRRWDSYSRRHRKAKRVTEDERVLDLAKGLQAHFEPGISYTHPSDWRALALALAQELKLRCE